MLVCCIRTCMCVFIQGMGIGLYVQLDEIQEILGTFFLIVGSLCSLDTCV